jgi:hypothetical protein
MLIRKSTTIIFCPERILGTFVLPEDITQIAERLKAAAWGQERVQGAGARERKMLG